MAQILIRLQNNTNPIPEKDLECYKTGMPVVVMPDDHIWGNEERPPGFFVLSLPGIEVDRVLKYIEIDKEQDGTNEFGKPIMKMVRRRLWRFRVENMPLAARNKILAGLITIGPNGDYTWAQVRKYLRNLRTGQVETADI